MTLGGAKILEVGGAKAAPRYFSGFKGAYKLRCGREVLTPEMDPVFGYTPRPVARHKNPETVFFRGLVVDGFCLYHVMV